MSLFNSLPNIPLLVQYILTCVPQSCISLTCRYNYNKVSLQNQKAIAPIIDIPSQLQTLDLHGIILGRFNVQPDVSYELHTATFSNCLFGDYGELAYYSFHTFVNVAQQTLQNLSLLHGCRVIISHNPINKLPTFMKLTNIALWTNPQYLNDILFNCLLNPILPRTQTVSISFVTLSMLGAFCVYICNPSRSYKYEAEWNHPLQLKILTTESIAPQIQALQYKCHPKLCNITQM